MEVRKLCEVEVIDSTPPRVVALGFGSCAAGSVPLVILVATVVSVVALAAKDTPFVLRQTIANVPVVVQSPDRSPFVMVAAPENLVRFPLAGEPVVVTVPVPAGKSAATRAHGANVVAEPQVPIT
jgi:hypothetical protein